MKIKHLNVYEEGASQDTLVCQVTLLNGIQAAATLSYSFLDSYTPQEIIDTVATIISPFFEGKICEAVECDTSLEEIYNAEDKSFVPRSVINAFSNAFFQAQAQAEQIQLFEFFADIIENETVAIPYPFFQLNDEQAFAPAFAVQQLYLLPLGASSFRHSLTSFEEVKKIVTTAFDFSSFSCAQDVITTINSLLEKNNLNDVFMVGLKGNADVLYDSVAHTYQWGDGHITSEELLLWHKKTIESHHVFSFQNSFAHKDILASRTLLELFGDKVQLISDETFLSQDSQAIEKLKTYANACVVKPELFLTISQALVQVNYLRSQGINVIIAPLSVNNPEFLVDFAVGTSAGQIKTFNHLPALTHILFERLLDIEDAMTFSLLFQE